MSTIKSILVPYDFSECANDALRVAATIARSCSAEIDIVHVYENVASTTAEKQRMREELDEKIKQIPKIDFLQGITLKKFMLREMSVSEIFKNEHLLEADLVVMGTHGAEGLRSVVGSNTQRVVRNAPMPVLAIKKRIEDFRVENVVFASNFSPQDITNFNLFKPFFSLFNPRVHLLKVNTPKHFERSLDSSEAIGNFLADHDLEKYSTTIFNDITIEEGILNFAKSIDADLIAMSTHGRSGFFSVLSGSITEDVVNHASFPILSAKL